MSAYEKHGEFLFTVRDHIVICELIGPFNEEGLLAWIDEIKNIVSAFNGRHFCALVDHRQHQGVIGSALHHLDHAYAWLADKNLLAVASLYSTYALHQIAITNLTLTHPAHIKPFTDRQAALSWLNAVYTATLPSSKG